MSQEAALAIAEKEKARAKAAMEAAEEARRRAEQEAQRRKDAEEKARVEAEEKERALSTLAQNDTRYRRYTIEEIELATEKFSPSNKIGEGGYGPVFKGHLDHTPVAIKILRPDASQGMKQFNQEVTTLVFTPIFKSMTLKFFIAFSSLSYQDTINAMQEQYILFFPS